MAACVGGMWAYFDWKIVMGKGTYANKQDQVLRLVPACMNTTGECMGDYIKINIDGKVISCHHEAASK